MQVQFEPLPKIQGTGRRSTGLWPGHEEEANLLRESTRGGSEDWGMIATGLKTHAASRIANLINQGTAEHFAPDDEGYFEARTRRNPANLEEYDLWARFVLGPRPSTG